MQISRWLTPASKRTSNTHTTRIYHLNMWPNSAPGKSYDILSSRAVGRPVKSVTPCGKSAQYLSTLKVQWKSRVGYPRVPTPDQLPLAWEVVGRLPWVRHHPFRGNVRISIIIVPAQVSSLSSG